MSATYAETEPSPEPPAVAAETEASTRPPRIHSLIGLRIFAAGVAYLSHLGAPKGGPEWLGTMMTSGYSGVTLFFVLSGFVRAEPLPRDARPERSQALAVRGRAWRGSPRSTC